MPIDGWGCAASPGTRELVATRASGDAPSYASFGMTADFLAIASGGPPEMPPPTADEVTVPSAVSRFLRSGLMADASLYAGIAPATRRPAYFPIHGDGYVLGAGR
jgi:hypothetical protein